MEEITPCTSIDEVRYHIDRIDRDIVALIARRGAYVAQAAGFKKDDKEVKAPQRVAQIIDKVRNLAAQSGADPDIVEKIYQAMISEFIRAELAQHQSGR